MSYIPINLFWSHVLTYGLRIQRKVPVCGELSIQLPGGLFVWIRLSDLERALSEEIE